MSNHSSDLFQLISNLSIDAMYYNTAWTNYNSGVIYKSNVDTITNEILSMHPYHFYVQYDLGDEIDFDVNYEDLEKIETLRKQLSEVYGLLFQSIATCQIFCLATLEAHINSTAKELLHGKMFNEFEKVTIEGKWLMLPVLLGLNGFDPGLQPFQNFSKLAKIRNSLVHYKEKHSVSTDFTYFTFQNDLGLTLDQAKQSLDATKSMITELSTTLKKTPPQWVTYNQSSYFTIEITTKTE